MAEPLSPEGYAAAGGSCCPWCGAADLAHGRLGQQGTVVLQPMACLQCLARWRNVYELTGYEAQD